MMYNLDKADFCVLKNYVRHLEKKLDLLTYSK